VKITKSQLKQLIKEELESVLEQSRDGEDWEKVGGPGWTRKEVDPGETRKEVDPVEYRIGDLEGQIKNISDKVGAMTAGLEDRISTLEQQMQNMFLKQK